MSLLRIQDVSKRLGGRTVLRKVRFEVNHGERLGLIGSNGSGKTTLLEVIANESSPDDGEIFRSKNLNVRLHKQLIELDDNASVEEFAGMAFVDLRQVGEELAAVEEAMEKEPHREDLEKRHGRLQLRFEHEGGYTYQAETERVLDRLGFSHEMRGRPVKSLSGGEKVRLALARTLLTPADLWLLDEPTNHLDLARIDWLEKVLKQRGGALIVVSHDRTFLDRVVDRIVHLERGGSAFLYRGGYQEFLRQRAERIENAKRQKERLEEERARQVDFVRKNIAGQNVSQARSRQKKLQRLDSEAEELPIYTQDERSLVMDFTNVPRLGNRVIDARGICKQFGETPLLRGVHLTVGAGDVVGLIGPNGSGKSTLLRILAKELEPDEGEVHLGGTVRLAMYHQESGNLAGHSEAIEEILSARSEWTPGTARSYLARFGFRGEEVFACVDNLSGGERSRLALARLLLSSANLLFFDEPTNHLDIPGREALETHLSDYPGAAILVTHDRWLLSRVVDRVVEILPDGTVREIEGKWGGDRRENGQEHPESRNVAKGSDAFNSESTENRLASQPSEPIRKRRYNYETLERLIIEHEEEMAEIQAQMEEEDVYSDHEQLMELTARLSELETDLAELYQEWETWT